MKNYFDIAPGLIKKFPRIRIEHIPREQNAHADALAGLASACKASDSRSISFGVIDRPSFELESIAQEVMNFDMSPSWMDEIRNYLKHDILLSDKKEAFKLRNKATMYWLDPTSDKMYRRSFTGLYLLVVHRVQIQGVIEELHAGESGCHSG